jgi:hypothetical protein
MAKATEDSTTSDRLSLSEARARVVEVVGSPEFAEIRIFAWLASKRRPRFDAAVIDGPLPGEFLKKMTRKEAEAEVLRDLFGPGGPLAINWEEGWVRKRIGVFVFTVYGIRIGADDFEALLANLTKASPSQTEESTKSRLFEAFLDKPDLIDWPDYIDALHERMGIPKKTIQNRYYEWKRQR